MLATIAGVALAAYLTATGADLRLLKLAATGLGRVVDGQRTDAITIDATVLPDEQRIEAHARVKLVARHEPRRRFYFLLNDWLSLRNAHVVGGAAIPTVYRLWLITVVELPKPLAADDAVEVEFDYDGRPAGRALGIGGGVFDARDVLLTPEDFWYPNDLSSFFQADVAVTLPTQMTLVHNGHEIERAERGSRHRVRWQSDRPIAGMSLVAGPYRRSAATFDTRPVQLFVADDVTIDGDRVLRDAGGANAFLASRYGESGFPQLTLFVTRRIRRAFNDGAGTIGLSIRCLRRGEYGFGTIAHEIAHNWWGATVSEHWLAPGTGGEWIVEGLAEFSSLLAVEDRWGRDALTAALTNEVFDPARDAAVSEMSALDNALAEAAARDTIYHKGAYVALMLRTIIGDDAMQQALRQFIERSRYTQVTDRDFESVVTQSTGQNVSQFFSDWVRSAKNADLALEPSGNDQVDVRNRGDAVVPSPIDLWVLPSADAALEKRRVRVGETVALPSGAQRVVLDPQLAWADMVRLNNAAPRRATPQSVAVSSRGDVLVAKGEPYPWAPVTLTQQTAGGKRAHSWEFERGLTQLPAWSADGARIVASVSQATGEWPAIVALNAVDGSRATIGYANAPGFGANGRIFAARGDRLLRFDGNRAQTIVRHRRANIESPT
ncbi:MAG TPA: M1 family aminopeptidase, partial [Pseudomonadales bacterium]|nr:M1 family aminopeptidase [Pseudomonadales bacterium]